MKDELRTELIVLSGAVKKLDRDCDFSEVIWPLLTDQGPASATIQRLSSSKQIVRLKKIGNEFLTKQQRETPGAALQPAHQPELDYQLSRSVRSPSHLQQQDLPDQILLGSCTTTIEQ
jgi:hypothetical protein